MPDLPAPPARVRHYYGLPAWAYPGNRSRDHCRVCGKLMAFVDDIEGLPVYACPDRCVPSPGARPCP